MGEHTAFLLLLVATLTLSSEVRSTQRGEGERDLGLWESGRWVGPPRCSAAPPRGLDLRRYGGQRTHRGANRRVNVK